MHELALFAGAGGGILGGRLLGWRTVCAVEIDPYCRDVLMARQNDGTLEPFPIWDDVRTFDGRPWRGRVDVVSGGFPCQDISSAGRGAGIDGEKSGLWSEFARIIGEVRPQYVFVENSPMLTSRGLGRVLGDLAAMGFDAEWGVLGAHDAGAPHRRDRIWIAATHSDYQSEYVEPVDAEVACSSEFACWIRCRGCDGYWCRRHREHAHDCECPPIEEWRGSPYLLADAECQGLEGATRSGMGRAVEPTKGCDDVPDADRAHAVRDEPAFRPAEKISELGSDRWWQSEPDVGRVANGVASRMDRLRAIGNGQVPAVVARAWRELSERLRSR